MSLSASVLGGLCPGGAGQHLYQLLCPLLLRICQLHSLSIHTAACCTSGHTPSHMDEHHLLAIRGKCAVTFAAIQAFQYTVEYAEHESQFIVALHKAGNLEFSWPHVYQ